MKREREKKKNVYLVSLTVHINANRGRDRQTDVIVGSLTSEYGIQISPCQIHYNKSISS